MFRLPGRLPGSARYFHNGYTYYNDRRADNTIFRCVQKNDRGCRAKLYVENFNDLENAIVNVAGVHNHDGDHLLLLKEQFCNELLHLARTTLDPFRTIWISVTSKEMYSGILLEIQNYAHYLSRMIRARRSVVPPVPINLTGLGEILEWYPSMVDNFRGVAHGTDESVGLIFIHSIMMNALTTCTQLFNDGTFKIRPRQPQCAQVYIMHVRKMNLGFPAVFALTSSKTTEMYDGIWSKLFELIPALRENIQTITSDFERAQINSARNNFPNARISGCLFHYKQALVKKWDGLNIEGQYEYVLEKAYAVAHLPADKIGEGFRHVTEVVDNLAGHANANIVEKLQRFTAYLRTWWLPLAEVISVFKKPIRTNNAAENFHMHAVRSVGQQSNVYRMLDGISLEMRKTALDYQRTEAGLQVRRARPRELQSSDLEIMRAEIELELGRYTPIEFVNHIAGLRRYHLANVFQYNELNYQVDEELNNANVNENLGDIRFLQENIDPHTGPGNEFENVMVICRRRREREIIDRQQMPERAARPVERRRGRPRRERQNNEVDDVAPRARGRPRRIAQINEGAENNAPRRRGRPRRVQIENADLEAPAHQNINPVNHAPPARPGSPLNLADPAIREPADLADIEMQENFPLMEQRHDMHHENLENPGEDAPPEDFIDPAMPLEPAGPAIPLDHAGPVIPIDPAGPAMALGHAQVIMPLEPVGLAMPLDPVDPVMPLEPANPALPLRHADFVTLQAVHPAMPLEPANHALPLANVAEVVEMPNREPEVDAHLPDFDVRPVAGGVRRRHEEDDLRHSSRSKRKRQHNKLRLEATGRALQMQQIAYAQAVRQLEEERRQHTIQLQNVQQELDLVRRTNNERTIPECVICRSNIPKKIWTPCGHACSCADCLPGLCNQRENVNWEGLIRCPVCRTFGTLHDFYL